MINDVSITQNSRKQSVTAQSSIEAEYMAVSEAAKQAVQIWYFLYSIRKEAIYNIDLIIIYKDN